ncbi:hypothetical protein TSUD_227620 [Trifolium subterraneum]|uniref:Uncharacterized protein n=1 Tax=Trifolium subterraneum TaxID=3900 RepID=A0A2Z6LTR5_TRISU|nr:hypothetical protein TSUD_227620 [Trifolium subterraneum]
MMQHGGMELQPDDATFVVTLSACGAIGALDFGRKERTTTSLQKGTAKSPRVFNK